MKSYLYPVDWCWPFRHGGPGGDVLVGVAIPSPSSAERDGANMKKALEEKGYIVDLSMPRMT